jgi:hypothetical protein
MIDIQYFGNICYYLDLLKSTYIDFDNRKWHKKGQSLNRMSIYGPNKVIDLSVPLEGGRAVKSLIKDLKIANRNSWQRIHWRSIHDSYRKAPWFEEYAPELERLYLQNYNFLWDWNINTVNWSLKVMGLNKVILSEMEDPPKKEEGLHSFCDQQKWPIEYPPYHQVFSDRHGFIANLSIVDLIMNLGPEAINYLSSIEVKDSA